MKKRKMIAYALLSTSLGMVSCSSEDAQLNSDADSTEKTEIAVKDLPSNSQTLLSTYFANYTTKSSTKSDQENYFQSKFAVALAANTMARFQAFSAKSDEGDIEIKFNKEGEWTEIESDNNLPLPADFLANEVPAIALYIADNYPDTWIVEIQRDKKGYEVSLNTDLELVFDVNQNFVGLDDDENSDVIYNYELPTNIKQFVDTTFPDATIVFAKKVGNYNGGNNNGGNNNGGNNNGGNNNGGNNNGGNNNGGNNNGGNNNGGNNNGGNNNGGNYNGGNKQKIKPDYKVFLNNGIRLEFDKDGNWILIDSEQNAVIPNTLLSQTALDYIQVNFQGYALEAIIKMANTYKVELENGTTEVEILFDYSDKVISVDIEEDDDDND